MILWINRWNEWKNKITIVVQRKFQSAITKKSKINWRSWNTNNDYLTPGSNLPDHINDRHQCDIWYLLRLHGTQDLFVSQCQNTNNNNNNDHDGDNYNNNNNRNGYRVGWGKTPGVGKTHTSKMSAVIYLPTLFSFFKMLGSIFQTRGRGIIVHHQPLWQALSKPKRGPLSGPQNRARARVCVCVGGGGGIWYYIPHLPKRGGGRPPWFPPMIVGSIYNPLFLRGCPSPPCPT